MKKFYFKGLKVIYSAPLSNSDKAIILCPGLPVSSINEKQISALAQKDFHVFYVLYPGYPGSSKTLFLLQNPANLISELITLLRAEGAWGIHLNTFFLIGSSFGGSVVLDVENADKIVAISPVIDYKNLYKKSLGHNYETLKEYLLKKNYNISQDGWDKLKKGKLFKFSGKPLSEKALIIYNEDDLEINPTALKKFVRSKRIQSISIRSHEHLSFKNIPPDIFALIFKWLGEDNVIFQYNNDAIDDFKKIASKSIDNQSAIIITGSLASGNFIPESDIDYYIISEHANLKIADKIKSHIVEAKVMTFRDFSSYVNSNMRGMSKLFSSKIITNNQNLQIKIVKLQKRLMNKYKELFLIFQILEKKRMEAVQYANNNSSLAIKKGHGGRRSLGFVTVTYNALNDVYNPSFWNSLDIMIYNRIVVRTDKKHIECFFNKLIQRDSEHQKLEKLLKINKKIIDRYTNKYFLKEIKIRYDLDFSKNMKKANIKGRANDMIDAFYSSDPARLTEIARTYKRCKDAMRKYAVFYYLALNNNLPIDISEFIALKFVNQPSMNNIRRNLVENKVTTTHGKLLILLSNDPDQKVAYYAKMKLAEKNILRIKIIRHDNKLLTIR